MECTPGSAEVQLTGDVSGNLQEKAERVRAAVDAGWVELQVLKRKLKVLVSAGRQLSDATRNLRGIGGQVAQSALCLAQAFTAIPVAMDQVSVSLEVSVEVSASASVSGG